MSKSRDPKDSYIDCMRFVELELERNKLAKQKEISKKKIEDKKTFIQEATDQQFNDGLKELEAELNYLEKNLEVNKDEKTNLIKEINKKRGNGRNKSQEKNQIQIIAAFQQELLSVFETCDRLKIDAPNYVTQEDLIKICWANSGIFSALSYQPAFMQRLLGYVNGQQSKEAKERWDAFYAQIRSIEQINLIPDFFLNLDAYNKKSGLALSIQKLIAKLQQIQNHNQEAKKHSANAAQDNLSSYMNVSGSKLKILTKDFLSYSVECCKCDVEFAVLTEKQQQLSSLRMPTQEQESELNSIQLSLDALSNQIPQNRKKSNQSYEELTLFLNKSLKELDVLSANQKKDQDQASILMRELKLLMDEATAQFSKQKHQLEFEDLYQKFMQYIANIANQVDIVENKSKAEALAPAILQQLTKLSISGQSLPKCISQKDLIKICLHLPENSIEFLANLLVQGRLKNGDGSETAKGYWNKFYKDLKNRSKAEEANHEKNILRYLNNEPAIRLIQKLSIVQFELEELSAHFKNFAGKLDKTDEKKKNVVLNFQKYFSMHKPFTLVDSQLSLVKLYTTLVTIRKDLMKQNTSETHTQSFFAQQETMELRRQLHRLKTTMTHALTEIELRFRSQKTLNQSDMWRKKINPDNSVIASRRVRLNT